TLLRSNGGGGDIERFSGLSGRRIALAGAAPPAYSAGPRKCYLPSPLGGEGGNPRSPSPLARTPRMRRFFPCGRKTLAALAVLLVLAAGAWWQRTPLLAWYSLRGLAAADEAGRAAWAARVARLDGAAVPGLLDLLA